MEYSRSPKGHGLQVTSRSSSPVSSIDEIQPLNEAPAVSSQHEVSHSNAPLETSQEESKPANSNDLPPLLRYRKRTLWLLGFYLPLLIIPWVLICVLAVRRLDGGPYFEQSGLSPKALLNIAGWVLAADILGSINGVATIPVISALLAQAAVVHCQKRRVDQKFSLRQTFALADRGWSDITILWGSWDTGATSRFLWFAAGLIAISAINQPLQSAFVTYAPVTVMTCIDEPIWSCDASHIPTHLYTDPEPAQMATISQNLVVQGINAELNTRSEYAVDPYMWNEYPNNNDHITGTSQPFLRETIYYYDHANTYPTLAENETYFVAALPNDTTTGVLRQHAIRLNSTVSCKNVSSSEFPSACSGARPFTASFSRPGILDIQVCVPGEYGVYPWSISRNRQDITEEIFFNVSASSSWTVINSPAQNFSMHCTASTTRGYFELGNYRNEYRYGPLKEKWPSPEEMKSDFNDHLSVQGDFARPSEQDQYADDDFLDWQRSPVDPFGTYDLNMSGPLMTSAIAIFGNSSFFHIASNASNETFPYAATQICWQDKIPFSRLGLLKFEDFQSACSWRTMDSDPERAEDVLIEIMNGWAYAFHDPSVAQEAFSMSTFVANKVMLLKTADASMAFAGRPIYTADGLTIARPVKTLPATIIVSILILLQLIGIAITTWYIYQMPSWSHALDAIAIARIGASIRDVGEALPPISALREKDLKGLAKIDGLIGVAEEDMAMERGEHERDLTDPKLQLGGSGVVPKKYKTKKRKAKKNSKASSS